MKTIYQHPTIKVVKIMSQPLLTVSNTGGNTKVSVSQESYDRDKGDILSREAGMWDDEE